MSTQISYPSQAAWESAAATLSKSHNSYQFQLGDWLNDGANFITEEKSRYKRAAALTHLSGGHLRNVAYVAANVITRNDKVSWNHHMAVASLPPERQAALLQWAAEEPLKVAELRKLVNAETGFAPKEKPPKTRTSVNVSEQRMRPIMDLAAARGTTVEDLVGTLIDDLLARPESVRALDAYAALHPVAPTAEVVATDAAEEYTGPPRVVFQTNELKYVLSQLKSVVNTKGMDAVYSHVRIFAEDAVVKITGVDIGKSLTSKSLTITIKSGRADGDVDLVVLFDTLNATVANITAPEMVITQMTTSGTLNGGGFSASIERLPADQFTSLPIVQCIKEVPEFPIATLGLAGLKRQFKDVEYAVKKSDGKFEVGPVKVESTPENLRLVATDGHMLAISEVPQNAGEFEAIIPEPAFEALARLTGDTVSIFESDNGFYFTTELETLNHWKIAPEFPPYQKVVPKTTDGCTKIVVDRDDFLAAINRARPFVGSAEKPIVILTVKNSTSLGLQTDQEHPSDDSVPAIVTGPLTLPDGSPVDVSLDSSMLLGFVERAAGLVTFYIKNNKSVVDFYNGNIRFLQMPCNAALRWAARQAEKLRRQAEAEAAAAVTAISVALPDNEPGNATIHEAIVEEEVAA